MNYIKVVIIMVLIGFISQNCDTRDGFMSQLEIDYKTNDLYKNRDVFKPGVGYGSVKNRIYWVDPVVYDDVYRESLKNKLTYSNLEKIFK
jgi:hypothetical protein